ncbi:tetratricopeptide repeat protein [Lutispora saccharofermentans]|uniref:Tetratricopeptide repeat protein n=1 Tax=Lutispora saccharofermentans TaxID=3024236 RepID=A0ABT1NHG7_9FIRM|nr:tetratricopeptide repeat protein [Lutispora saccharofermentans]MCQ1530044.1 hypothetical protein [Lutispora saccharofermentans]
MKYFKIKVKYLILLLIALSFLYASVPFAYSKIAKGYERKGKIEHAAVYYEKSLSLVPDFLKSGEDIYDYANTLSSGAMEHSLYKIFPYGHGGAGNNMVPTDEALNTAISLYKDLIENHSSDPWAKWAHIRLAEIYIYLGDYKEAEKYLMSGKTNADAGLIYVLYNSTGEYDKGINLLEDLIENNKSYFDMNYYDGLANLYIQSGKYDEAIYTYKQALNKTAEINKDSSEEYLIDKKEELKVKIKKAQEMEYNKEMEIKGIDSEMGECRGRVTVDGKGVEGVRVYIKDKEIYKDNYIGSTLDFPFTTTDKDGYYSIDDVLPGEYDIGIGIRPHEILGKAYLDNRDDQRILQSRGILLNDFEFKTSIEILTPDDEIKVSKDKLEISWKEYEGAESYSLVAGLMIEGSYGTSIFADKIKENKAVIDIKKVAPGFMGLASFNDENRPTPGTLLGMYGEGKVIYGVQAYDRNGKLISSSMPVIKTTKLPRHFVLITQKLEGDNLIKAEQYEKARDWFLNYLDKNPEDVHSLYVLSRYYEYCEEDYAKAKEYLNRLYQITKIEEYKSHMEGLSDK